MRRGDELDLPRRHEIKVDTSWDMGATHSIYQQDRYQVDELTYSIQVRSDDLREGVITIQELTDKLARQIAQHIIEGEYGEIQTETVDYDRSQRVSIRLKLLKKGK